MTSNLFFRNEEQWYNKKYEVVTIKVMITRLKNIVQVFLGFSGTKKTNKLYLQCSLSGGTENIK